MAIQNDPRLYSGGVVEFDSTPTLNTFARLNEKRMAEDKAREEAANQYFTNVVKELNPAGIRQIHLGGVQGQPKGIIDRINEWKDWSIKNRGTIAKGGTARMQSDMMAQEIMRDIAKAKNRDKSLLELGKLKFEGKYDPTDDDFKLIEKFGKSIYDPESYKEDGVSEYGFEDLSPNIPDYDINKAFETGSKGMKGGRTFDEGKGRRDPQTGLEWIPYTEKFSDAQIPQIAKSVANEYATNKSAKKYWDTQFKKLSEEDYKQLNSTFKQYFPQGTIRLANGEVIDMNNIDTPEELALASTALRAKEFISEQGEVPKSDYQLKKQDNINKIYLQDGLIRGRQQDGVSQTPKVEGNEFDRLPIPKAGWFNKSRAILPEQIPSTTKAILKTAGVDIEGMEYFETEVKDGKIESITPVWKDKDGKRHKEGVITRKDMWNAQLKYNSEPQKGQQPQFGNQAPLRTPKNIKNTRMKNNPLGLDL